MIKLLIFLVIVGVFQTPLDAFSIDKNNNSQDQASSSGSTSPSGQTQDPTAVVVGGSVTYIKSGSSFSASSGPGFTKMTIGSSSSMNTSGASPSSQAASTVDSKEKFKLGASSQLLASSATAGSSTAASSSNSSSSTRILPSSFKMGQVSSQSSSASDPVIA